MFSLEHAFKRLKNEDYEYAIIAGANLCLNEMITMQFSRLGVLSKDGVCKAFDDTANGYVRSEGIVVSILQKAKTAKRIYGKVIYAKLNCDGYKSHGITFPSSEAQTVLLSEFYKECQVDPSTITYVEAHGTGKSKNALNVLILKSSNFDLRHAHRRPGRTEQHRRGILRW